MAVIVNQVSKQYGEQLALDKVSVSIQKGEVVGLLGPNGAGKSTLMKIISCFIPPSSGSVSVNGFDVMNDSMEVRKTVGYLPENNPLYVDMYVKEYLLFVAGIHQLGNQAKNRVDELVDMTGLGAEMHKKIEALSKGYRQRVGIAQALMHNPEVLILDEPTSGLDPNQLVEIRTLIRKLGQEKTIILSTHIMQEVEAVCNRVVIMNKGLVVADDQISNLTKSEKTNVLIVIFDREVQQSDLMQIKGIQQSKMVSQKHWILSPEKNIDLRPHLMQWAVDQKIGIQSMQLEASSMEETFRNLTR